MTTHSKTEVRIPFRDLAASDFDGLRFGEHLRQIWLAARQQGIDGRLVGRLRPNGKPREVLELDIGTQSFTCGHGTIHRGAGPTLGGHINGSAVSLTMNKAATKTLLIARGVPTPLGRAFDVAHRDEAIDFAMTLGGVVCVKPQAGAKGALVFPACRTEAEITDALEAVWAASAIALVERNVPGEIYRFIYCAPEIAGIRINRPLQVTGDGVSTIAELAEALNDERRRRNNPAHPPIEHGDDTAQHLASLGYAFETVLQTGRVVSLSSVSNFARGGGEALNIGAEMHPSYLEVARIAFEELKIGGIDMAIVDCTVPASDANCSVIEINSSPLIDAFYHPWLGKVQDTAASLVRMLQMETSASVARTPGEPLLDEHALLLEDAARAAGIRNETVELPGARGTNRHLRLFVHEMVFQYRQGAMRIWQPSDPAGPGKHINGPATLVTTSDSRTRRTLARAGFAVPRTAVFARDQIDEALAFARNLPAVHIRAPSDRKNDDPVPIDPAGISAALARVARNSPFILVEEIMTGELMSFLVADGRAVAAVRAAPAHVIGDGQSSVLALILRQQGTGLERALEVVCGQGLDFGSVPEAGRIVDYSRNDSIATGRLVAEGEVNPSHWRLAEQASAAIEGIRLCSVRLAISDLAAPTASNDSVLRISSSPGLAVFAAGLAGRDAPACNAVLDVLKTYSHD